MKFFTSKIGYLILLIIISIFSLTSPVSVDACEVKRTSATRFRTSYGTQMNQPDSFFNSDENPPFVYIDVDTDNCTSSDQINLRIWGITAVSTGGGFASDFNIPGQIFGSQGVFGYPIDLANQNIDSEGKFTITLKAGTELCTVFNDPYDCLIMAAFLNQNSTSILAILGNALGNLSQADADFFLSTFANLQGVIPTGNTGSECLSQGTNVGYYFQQSLSCVGLFPYNGYTNSYFSSSFDNLLLSYYNNYPGLNYQFSPDTESGESEFRIALPGIRFNCPGGFGDLECESYPWSIPVGAIIPYGESHPNDQGTVVTSPLSDIYQEDYVPLAPLPFEGLNGGPTPTLGEYLASMFRMGIVVVIILAVLMIVFHGIALATTGVITKKTEHKDGVWNAIIGLVLAMGSWLLLNTINTRLASDLSINIPRVSLDGPDPAWQNGNASSGTVISSSATLNGQPITQGMTWPDDGSYRNQLSNSGISVVSSGNSNCTPTAGTPNCTSVYFDSNASSVISNIIDLKSACGCELIVTGGSEAWLHSSHGPNKKVIDFRATPTLNQYLRNLPGGPGSGDTFPSGQTVIISGVGKFYAEPSGATGNTTAKHWHVTFY